MSPAEVVPWQMGKPACCGPVPQHALPREMKGGFVLAGCVWQQACAVGTNDIQPGVISS